MRSRLTSRLFAAISGTFVLLFALRVHAQGTPVQPGTEPPIGPIDVPPPAAEPTPATTEPTPATTEPTPAAQPPEAAPTPSGPVGPNGEPIDVPFELQTLH